MFLLETEATKAPQVGTAVKKLVPGMLREEQGRGTAFVETGSTGINLRGGEGGSRQD